MMEKQTIAYVTPRQISDDLNIPYQEVLTMMQRGLAGAIKGDNGRWRCPITEYEETRKRTDRVVKKLKSDYIALWWQGLTISQLQKRAEVELVEKGVLCHSKGFAELAIYEMQMARQEGKK